MNPACIVKFRPLGPWRIGPDSGDRDPAWIASITATHCTRPSAARCCRWGCSRKWLKLQRAIRPGAAVRFSSCFPFQGDTGFVAPPKSIGRLLASSKVRWKGARFVPLPLVELLLNGGALEEDRWSLDGQSECLVQHGRSGPFRIACAAPPPSTGWARAWFSTPPPVRNSARRGVVDRGLLRRRCRQVALARASGISIPVAGRFWLRPASGRAGGAVARRLSS